MKHHKRHPNQYSQSDFRPLYLMLVIMAIGAYLNYRFQPVELHYPLVGEVKALELPVKVTTEPLNTYGAPAHVVDLIVKYFGDEAQNALKIVGTCENGKWNPKATNQNRNGSWDAGIFQINSVHGYSQEYLFNPENNVRVAKKIFNSRGWTSWSCAHVLGITPFYMKGIK